jgi:plasmid segregation protein ParM
MYIQNNKTTVGGRKMRYAITVDPGKDTTKAICSFRDSIGPLNEKKTSFPTRLYDLSNGDIEIQGNSFHVVYDDKELVIGEQGELYDTQTTKTSLLHKLAIFSAISKLIDPLDKEPCIVLTVGCPTTIFRNKSLKEEYREYIKSNPIVIINNRKHLFNFEKIIIKNEGSGIVYLEPNIFLQKRVAVFDIGGKQFNFGIFDNRVLIPSSSFSNNFGGTKLQSLVRQELNIALGIDCSLMDAKNAIENGGIFIDGELNADSVIVIKTTISRFIKDYILKSLEESNISISLMPAVAVGGTSFSVLDEFKEIVPHLITPTKADSIETFQWANAEGFHIVCKVKAGMING